MLEGLIVRGDICSHKEVRICDDAVVCGNLFAEEDIHIGTNATIIGNVFTQGSVYIETGAMIGKPGSISSIIARDNITFEKNVFVYGYVSSERGGKIIDSNMETETHEYKLLDEMEYLKELRFTNIEDFEKIDEQGYRKEKMLSKVDILVPAKAIMKSMFFSCKELKSVILPNTLEEIGPYAFADCEKLKDVTTFKGMRIKSIGTSAFENCKEIESIELPKTLEVLGGAAFAGCTNLKKVIFAEGCELTTIGSHVFRGCTSLEEIVIPDKVQIMDLSVFKDCTALKSVSIPMACQMEPAIQEIWENLDIHIDVRKTGI